MISQFRQVKLHNYGLHASVVTTLSILQDETVRTGIPRVTEILLYLTVSTRSDKTHSSESSDGTITRNPRQKTIK